MQQLGLPKFGFFDDLTLHVEIHKQLEDSFLQLRSWINVVEVVDIEFIEKYIVKERKITISLEVLTPKVMRNSFKANKGWLVIGPPIQ